MISRKTAASSDLPELFSLAPGYTHRFEVLERLRRIDEIVEPWPYDFPPMHLWQALQCERWCS